jgi:GH35 family endo-1,4-beta-xylanase
MTTNQNSNHNSIAKITSGILALILAACSLSPAENTVTTETQPSLVPNTPTYTATASQTPTVEPTATIETSPTLVPTKSPEQVLAEFKESAEYKQGLQDYLNAMGLEAGNVKVAEKTKVINGKEYRFLVATPDQDKLTPEQKKYMDVFQPVPLFILLQDEHDLRWTNNPRIISKIVEFPLGVLLQPNFRLTTEIIGNHFSIGVVTSSANNILRKTINTEAQNYDLTWPERQVELAKINNQQIRFQTLLHRDRLPEDFRNLTREQAITLLENYFSTIFNYFETKHPGIIEEYVVLSEARPNEPSRDVLARVIGQDYPEIIFKIAALARDQVSPQIKIGYIDTENLLSSDKRSNLNKEILSKIFPFVDFFGVEGHTFSNPNLNVANAVGNLNAYKDLLGKEGYIIIAENDISLKNDTSTLRLFNQATTLSLVLEIAKKADVESFTFWGIGDSTSWLEEPGREKQTLLASPNADPTIFNDQMNPKPAYYTLMIFFYNSLSQ